MKKLTLALLCSVLTFCISPQTRVEYRAHGIRGGVQASCNYFHRGYARGFTDIDCRIERDRYLHLRARDAAVAAENADNLTILAQQFCYTTYHLYGVSAKISLQIGNMEIENLECPEGSDQVQ